MDNKIYEEALSNLIRRIEDLEDKISRISIPNKNGFHEPTKPFESKIWNKQSDVASSGQLKYLKILNGNITPGMTKSEAGKEIDRLVKLKNSIKEEKKENDYLDFEDNYSEEVIEPKEVDTEESGVDEEGFL